MQKRKLPDYPTKAIPDLLGFSFVFLCVSGKTTGQSIKAGKHASQAAGYVVKPL